MAKALMGHMGSDSHLIAQVASLKARVRQLEAEVADLQSVIAAQQAAVLAESVDLTDLDTEFAQIQTATPALT